MVFRDIDKEAIKQNAYKTLAKISIIGDNTVLTEENFISELKYEDFRYVPDNGFIGQFVERILDGKLQDLPDNVILENAEINFQLGIINGIDNVTTFYDYGNFLITDVSEKDVSGVMSFESADYCKKFNTVYTSNLPYPCLALEVLNDAVKQVDVGLNHNELAFCYPIDEEGLEAGSYCFVAHNEDDDTETYYEFTTTKDLKYKDSLMFRTFDDKVVQKSIDDDYNIDRIELDCTINETSSLTQLSARECYYVDFENNDFVVINNQFQEDATCRDVVKAITKLAYSWARIGVDNKLYIDFVKKDVDNIDDYNKLNTDEYYDSTKKDLKFGPVNKVIVGMSQIEGENIIATSSDYSEENECYLEIMDNPLTYTEELRRIAINGCDKLFGLEYTPLEINSIGHPWLEGDDYIKLTNVDDDELYTYAFNRSITYRGYITGSITSEAKTINEIRYENPKEIINRLAHTEVIVDKNTNAITSLTTLVEENRTLSTETKQTVDGLSTTVQDLQGSNTELGDRITTVETTLSGIETTKTVVGGSNLIKNSVGYFGSDYWQLDEEQEGRIKSDSDSDVTMNSISGSALLLQNEEVYQNISSIKTGDYYLSFTYKKLINLANCQLIVNDVIIELDNNEWTEVEQHIVTDLTSLNISLISDTDDSCLVTDLMLCEGTVKTTWSQNNNETYTDSVKIGKGIQITATGSDTMLEAVAEGINIRNTSNNNVTSKFTKYGTETNKLTVHDSATISDSLLINKVGGQIWISTIN